MNKIDELIQSISGYLNDKGGIKDVEGLNLLLTSLLLQQLNKTLVNEKEENEVEVESPKQDIQEDNEVNDEIVDNLLIHGNEYDMSRLFNPSQKLEFINSRYTEDNTKKNVYYAFLKCAEIEEKLNRDVSDMTFKQFERILKGSNYSTRDTLLGFYSHIITYTNWCVEQGHVRDNLLKRNFTSIVDDYVYAKNKFYTQDELLKTYVKFKDSTDIFIIQALFEGIKGTSYSELFNLKVSDFSKKRNKITVVLFDSVQDSVRELEVSEFLYTMALKASADREYVLDKRLNTDDIKSSYNYIAIKFSDYRKIFKDNNLNTKVIEMSGIMHFIYEKLNGNVIDKNVLNQVSDKFNYGKQFRNGKVERLYPRVLSKFDLNYFNKTYKQVEIADTRKRAKY